MVTPRELTEPYATGRRPSADAAEGIYRHVNERIRELWQSYDFGSPMQVFCECSEPECTALIPVHPDRYDDIRVAEVGFIVVPEHAPAEANVIERSPDYWVVEEQP